MGAKVRAIIKRPDEPYGHVTNISTSLHNLQGIVEGYIETVPLGEHSVIICNEEGKLNGLPYNFTKRLPDGMPVDVFVGTIVVIGRDGEEFSDLEMPFATWKQLLIGWGN